MAQPLLGGTSSRELSAPAGELAGGASVCGGARRSSLGESLAAGWVREECVECSACEPAARERIEGMSPGFRRTSACRELDHQAKGQGTATRCHPRMQGHPQPAPCPSALGPRHAPCAFLNRAASWRLCRRSVSSRPRVTSSLPSSSGTAPVVQGGNSLNVVQACTARKAGQGTVKVLYIASRHPGVLAHLWAGAGAGGCT